MREAAAMTHAETVAAINASLLRPDTTAEKHGVYPLRPRPVPEPPRAA